jgi:hypothetical protein
VIALAAVAIAGFAARRLLVSDTDRIHKSLDTLAACVSKASTERNPGMLLKTEKLQGLFADPCVLRIPRYNLVEEFTPREIVSEVVRARALAKRVDVRFLDRHVEFPTKDDAVVTCTAHVVAEADGTTRETAEIQCRLTQTQKRWLFTEFREVQVLER